MGTKVKNFFGGKGVFCKYFMPIIFGVSVLGILTYYKLVFGIRLMESDSASDIFYAHLLSTEGKIISNNWYFSTELRLLDNELLFALLFKLFPQLSWWEIETVGTAIMNGLLGIASVMLAYQLKLGHKSLWMFGFSLLPYGTSEYYYTLMHGCGYYVYAVIEVFVILSLFLSIINYRKKDKACFIGNIICYLGLSLLIGMQGIRLLANLYAPLLLSSICFFVYGIWQNENGYKCQDMEQRKKILGFAFGGVCVSSVGYVINTLVLSQIYTWRVKGENLQLKEFSVEPVSIFIREIFSNLGFIGGVNLFSICGFISFLSIVIFLISLLALVGICRRGRIFQNNNFIVLFFIVALFIHLLVYIFLQKNYKARYMLPFFMLLPCIICLVFEQWKNSIKKFLIPILGVCVLMTSINVAYYWHLAGNHQGINIAKQKEMAEFLVDNNYKYGFSTYWYTNSTIQLSNGQLEICPVSSTEVFDKYEWLCPKNSEEYSDYDKIFFIVSDTQLEAGREKPWNQEEKIVWHDGGICVFEYRSVEELRNVINVCLPEAN